MGRFLCTGDLHLGAGADLGVEPGERLADQEAVWLSIVEMANELDATILFAGDAWERRRPTPVELLAFRRPLDELRKPLLGVTGNHDVEGYRRPTGFDVFYLGAGRAAVYGEPRIVHIPGALVACLPWAPPTHLVALEGGGDRDDLNVRLAEGLVEIARGLFAEIELERERRIANGAMAPTPAILLTHWSISGAAGSSGFPVDLMREPVLPLAALEAIGFDAVVAGHIHRPQMLGERGFYVGSPMPLNFGEADHEHVVWLLDLDTGPASGEDPRGPVSFGAFQIPVPSRTLFQMTIHLGEGPFLIPDLAGDAIARERLDGAIVKVKIHANEEQSRGLDVAALKAEILAAGARKVWAIQTEVERAELVRGVAVDETLGDVEAMELYLEAEGHDPDHVEGLLERHVAYLERIGR